MLKQVIVSSQWMATIKTCGQK